MQKDAGVVSIRVRYFPNHQELLNLAKVELEATMKLIGLEKERIAKAEAEAAAKVSLLKTRSAEVESKSKELDEYLSAERARLAKNEEE